MTELTREEKITLIEQLIKHKRDMDVFREKFDELFGVLPGFEGNGDCHYQVFDNLFNDFIKMVAKEIGDSDCGINWFVWENDCGKEGLEADVNGEMKIIKTASDYIDFVEADY